MITQPLPTKTCWTAPSGASPSGERRRPLFLVRLLQYEYWSWWLFYLPLLPYGLWLAVKTRSLTFFTAANPGIDAGGFFGEGKAAILDGIDDAYKAKTVWLPAGAALPGVRAALAAARLAYPLVVKPNVGERGAGVARVDDDGQLAAYLAIHGHRDLLAQEYVDYPLELGVMYVRLPGAARGTVTSVTWKTFLSVTGDGRSTVAALLRQSDRGRLQEARLRTVRGAALERVPAAGETVVVEPIGNHCLGTRFNDGNAWIDERMTAVFDRIAAPVAGFFYGRFDLKTTSLEDLRAGNNIRIMELNGVSSEPGHVFDPGFRLWRAYRDIARHWRLVAAISGCNMKAGVRPVPLRSLAARTVRHFRGAAKRPAGG